MSLPESNKNWLLNAFQNDLDEFHGFIKIVFSPNEKMHIHVVDFDNDIDICVPSDKKMFLAGFKLGESSQQHADIFKDNS